jgi:hypothetical protein
MRQYPSTLTARWLWGALTPTAACLLLTLFMLNSGNSVIRQKPGMTMILSNEGGLFATADDGQGGRKPRGQRHF